MYTQSRPIGDSSPTGGAGAVGTAVVDCLGTTARLHSVAEDPTAAVCARGRHRMRGAFEAVEHPAALALCDGERTIVLIAADVAGSHDDHSFEIVRCTLLGVLSVTLRIGDRTCKEKRPTIPENKSHCCCRCMDDGNDHSHPEET